MLKRTPEQLAIKKRNKEITAKFIAGATREMLMQEYDLGVNKLNKIIYYQVKKMGGFMQKQKVHIPDPMPQVMLFNDRDSALIKLYQRNKKVLIKHTGDRA